MESASFPAESRAAALALGQEHSSWHEGRTRYTAFLAKKIMAKTIGPVLDVGCGAGQFLAAMTNLGIPATGLDLSQTAVDAAASNSGAIVLKHDANEPWPFADRSFHAVTMFDVIEHLARYETALAEAWRVLKPGGSAFIVTVNRSSILRMLFGARWGALRDPGHVVYFDRKPLTAALRAQGFEVRESWTFFNLNVAGESSEFLLPFRRPGVIFYSPEFGDSIYVRAQKH